MTSQESTVPLARDVLRGLRILLVEDDRDICTSLVTMLTSYGAEVRCVGSSPEGLVALQEWRLDVLIGDIHMPGEDGFPMMRKVRALAAEQGGATPAISLTGLVHPQYEKRALEAGFQLHLGKPVRGETLVRAIVQVLGTHP